jgi:hypothetical protein
VVDGDDVWRRIERHAGHEFRQVRGKPFTYWMRGPRTITLDTTNRSISRAAVDRALARWPVEGPGALQDISAPSYVYALLADPRILGR